MYAKFHLLSIKKKTNKQKQVQCNAQTKLSQ